MSKPKRPKATPKPPNRPKAKAAPKVAKSGKRPNANGDYYA